MTTRRRLLLASVLSVPLLAVVGRAELQAAAAELQALGAPVSTNALQAPPRDANPAEALIDDSERRVEELERELSAGQTELDALRKRLALRGRAYVQLVRLGLLPVSRGFEGLVTHANQVEMLRRGLARDVVRQRELVGRAEHLRESVRAAEQQRGRLRNELGDFRSSREAILAARERELAYRRAFMGGVEDEHSTVYGSVGMPLTQAQSFSELKGRMPLPVEGRAEVRPVEADDDRGPGVELRVELGGVARVVYPGKIVFVGEYGGMGQAVVVEHGGGYSTLLGSLSRVFVEVGVELAGGAAVGELAEVRGRGRLYFEVRHQADRLYPAEWLGL
jgi:murein hydrolase activator